MTDTEPEKDDGAAIDWFAAAVIAVLIALTIVAIVVTGT